MDNDFNFKQVPHHWSLCYLSECERKEECMRYQVCQLMPEGMFDHPCVLPSVLKREECPRFHPIKKVRAAYGFRLIFQKVLAKDITEIRSRIARYLGSQATFFRYQRGLDNTMCETFHQHHHVQDNNLLQAEEHRKWWYQHSSCLMPLI